MLWLHFMIYFLIHLYASLAKEIPHSKAMIVNTNTKIDSTSHTGIASNCKKGFPSPLLYQSVRRDWAWNIMMTNHLMTRITSTVSPTMTKPLMALTPYCQQPSACAMRCSTRGSMV